MSYPALPPTIPLVAQLPSAAEPMLVMPAAEPTVTSLSDFKQQNFGRTTAEFAASQLDPPTINNGDDRQGNDDVEVSSFSPHAATRELLAPVITPFVPTLPDSSSDRVAQFLAAARLTDPSQADFPVTPTAETPARPGNPESSHLRNQSLTAQTLTAQNDVNPPKRRKKGKTPAVPPSMPSSTTPLPPAIELKADRQDYDEDRQILTAEGNVVMRYQGVILDADRVQISFLKRQAVAEGQASLVRGSQKLVGDRLEYNYGDGSGRVFKASSEVYLRSWGSDSSTLANNVGRTGVSEPLLSQRLLLQQPVQGVTQAGQFSFATSFGGTAGLRDGQFSIPRSGGSVNRLRLEADQILFDSLGWEARNVRVTNDPFSPPELELRARKARVRAIGPFEDELLMGKGRLVFDQRAVLPLLLQRYVINRRRNNPIPSLLEFGYDAQERGGFYIQRNQTLISNSKVQWSISPQFYLQAATSPRAFRQKLGIGSKTSSTDIFDPDLYGFRTDVQAALTPQTTFQGFLSLTSLSDLISNLRSRLALRHNLTQPRPNQACITRFLPKPKPQPPQSDTPTTPHSSDSTPGPLTPQPDSNPLDSTPPPPSSQPESSQAKSIPSSRHCGIYEIGGNYAISGEYTYRDRLFNGSLGFQTVQQSAGAILTSPIYQLGRSGVVFTYQASAQQVNADTDRLDLLPAIRQNSRIDLGRFQTSAALSRFTYLWQGQALPSTAKAGLKYTGTPVFPYIGINAGLTGVGTYYTSGDTQNYLQAAIGVQGQIGHFSRPYFDYTGFNLSISQIFFNGKSPFLFDRIADQRILSAGVTQQLYGPLRVGVQSALNLDTGKQISTDYILEYSRRTYSITLRFNPVQEIGSVNLIITDFNWSGGTHPFSSQEIRSVEGGVIQSNNE